MHIQKIHYWKVIGLMTCLAGSAIVIYTSVGPLNNNIDVELSVTEDDDNLEEDDQYEDEDQSRTAKESLAIAQLHTCPVCLGKGLCQELSQEFLTVSMFGDTEPGVGTTYMGLLQGEQEVTVFYPAQERWDNWDKVICNNSSQPSGCLVSEAVRTSFLSKSKTDAPNIRRLSSLMKDSVQPFTACATRNFARTLSKAFDKNKDETLTAEEKSVLLTTLAVSPAVAAHKFSSHLSVAGLSQTIGSCGRLVVTEGDLVPLSQMLDMDLATRIDLASQALDLMESLLSGDQDWVFIVWDLNIEDLSVTKTGQVVLSRHTNITPVDRTILLGPPDEPRDVCNLDCFDKWKKEVMMRTPRGQPGKGCSSALLYGDIMYSHLCLRVFLGVGQLKGRGLLHSAPPDLSDILNECYIEEGKGGRWQTVGDLVDYFAKYEEEDMAGGDDTTDNDSEEEEESTKSYIDDSLEDVDDETTSSDKQTDKIIDEEEYE